MSFNGSGTFSLIAGNPVVTGTTISSTWANNTLSDIATGLTTCIAKDGQTTPTANLPLGGFKLTGLGAATAATDSARLSTVQNSQGTKLGTIAGTNTITAQATPTLTAYADGQTFRFAPAGTNTGATTLNIDSLGAKNIFYNGSALTGNEIPASGMVEVIYDGTQFNLIANAGAGSAPFSDATAIVKNSSDATKLVKLNAGNITTGTTRTIYAPDADAAIGWAAFCQLQYVGTTSIKLVPFGGQMLQIAGKTYPIPSAGVTLTNSGLTAATLYYIYAFMSAGTMTLEASATAHATDTTAGNVGVEIKSADNTRTFVGWAYMDAGTPGTFASTALKQWVRSYYNHPGFASQSGLSADKTTTSTTYVQADSTTDISFISDGKRPTLAGLSGSVENSLASGGFFMVALSFNGTTEDCDAQARGQDGATGSSPKPVAISVCKILSEGKQTLTALIASNAIGNTVTLHGAAAPSSSTPTIRTSFWINA